MSVDVQEVLTAIERGAANGETIPPELVLWVARFAKQFRHVADMLYVAGQSTVDKESGAEYAVGQAMLAYTNTVQSYEDPTKTKASALPKSQAELWESCATRMAVVMRDMLDADREAIPENPTLIRALAALNGYNSLANKPLVEVDGVEAPDEGATCRVCGDAGKVDLSRCPACDKEIQSPSVRLGMPMDMAHLAQRITSPKTRARVTDHELDAIAVGYYICSAHVRQHLFPEMVLNVWEQWGSDICKPHVDMAPYVDQRALPEGPIGPEEMAKIYTPSLNTVIFRALRNEAETAFLVARMKPQATVAKLEDVQHVICTVDTRPGHDQTMRADYRAAEAFAAFLTTLPALVTLGEELNAVVEGKWLPVNRAIEGMYEVPVEDNA